MSGGSNDDGDTSMETPTLDATVEKVRRQISMGEMPSTAQLMAAIRANPFEAKFAEANRRLSQDLSPSTTRALVAAAIAIEEEADSAATTPSTASSQGPSARKLARKSSAGSGLSLKLPPPTLTSQSPGLFSNVSMLEDPSRDGGASMGTPEIARLVRQVKEDRISRVPGTAEVLESVLNIGTVEGGALETKAESDDARRVSSPPSINQPSHNMLDVGPNANSDDPPPINTLGGEVVGGGQDGYFLQLRVGNQMMRIPFDVALAGKGGGEGSGSSGGGVTESLQIPNLDSSGMSMSGMSTLGVDGPETLSQSWNGRLLTPGSAASSRGVSPVNPRIPIVKTELCGSATPPARGSSRGNFSGATSDGGETDEKRKDTLERNKAAAIRYRKRKKEELVVMQDKVRKVEEEKFELQTQVTVLKRELERMGKKLDVHRGCGCPCEAKARLDGSLDIPTSAMPYILQPVMMGGSHGAAHLSSAQHQAQANLQLLNFVLPPKVSPLAHSPHLPPASHH